MHLLLWYLAAIEKGIVWPNAALRCGIGPQDVEFVFAHGFQDQNSYC
jgi:hypothetical protein